MVELITENFQKHANLIPGLADSMKVFMKEGFSFVDSGLSCETFNIIHINRGEDVSLKVLSQSIEYYRAEEKDYCLWVCTENLTPEIHKTLESQGVEKQASEIGMVMNLDDHIIENKQTHRNIVIAENEGHVSMYGSALAENWNPPDEDVIKFYQQTSHHYLNANQDISLLIYLHEGKPVSTLEIFPSDDDTVGFYGLSTLSDYRGYGIGTSMMTFALNKVKESGYKKAILQATEDGIGIYKKMGFKEITTYFEYA